MSALAAPIASAACDREALPEAGVAGALHEIGRSLGLRNDAAQSAQSRASQAMAARLDASLRRSTEQLIVLHGLDGRAQSDVLARIGAGIAVDAPMSEGKAAMMGGVVSGALTGLVADLAAGGLTLGGGMLTGAVLGAFGGAGLARGLNLARGKTGAVLRWDDAFLSRLVGSALLRYLALAHYGRGRGDWAESEYPPFWPPLVAQIVDGLGDRLAALWRKREPACDADAIGRELAKLLADAATEALDRLYPGALPARRSA
jgi:hypothetical protein